MTLNSRAKYALFKSMKCLSHQETAGVLTQKLASPASAAVPRNSSTAALILLLTNSCNGRGITGIEFERLVFICLILYDELYNKICITDLYCVFYLFSGHICFSVWI